MLDKYLIVVSAENNAYMAWQAKLLHYSSVSRLNRTPLFVVHGSGGELHPGFRDILKAGGAVLGAPNYKVTKHGDTYPPRNTPGTLRHTAEAYSGQYDFFILCDPDMIFVRPPDFPETLSGDYYSYMNFDQSFVVAARQMLGIPPGELDARKDGLRCGCPYTVPAESAGVLADAWLAAVDALPPRTWEDVMYAFGLAAVKLGLGVTLTRTAQTNYWPDAKQEAAVIHYCYGDEAWNKRHYFTEEQAPRVWNPRARAPRETVLGEILVQIGEAQSFYLKH